MTVILDPHDGDQLEFAIRRLRELRPIGVPSETVYGLAGLAQSEKALAEIFRLKNRPNFDPLIVHALNLSALDGKVQWEFAAQKTLAKKFWPGPLTVLIRKTELIPDLCTAGSPWVACRVPSHPDFQLLLQALGGDVLAAPSANRFGSISPTSSKDVCAELGPFGLEAVVEGGRCQRGLESTVVKFHSETQLEVLRQGAISVEELAMALGPEIRIDIRASGSGVDESKLESPGLLKRHYAPRTPLIFCKENSQAASIDPSKSALLRVLAADDAFGLEEQRWAKTVCLSNESDVSEAAAVLFRTMRDLDDSELFDNIVAIPTKNQGLGRAINDRLRRAALY